MTATPSRMQSYEDWLRHGKFAADVIQSRAGPTAEALLVRTRQRQAFSDPSTPDIVLQLCYRADGQALAFDFGHGRRSVRMRAGDFFLAPANHFNYIAGGGAFELHALAWNSLALNKRVEAATGTRPDFAPLHARGFRSEELRSLLNRLWRHAGHPDAAAERLRFDACLNLVGAKLLELVAPRVAQRLGSRVLSAKCLAEVLAYIDEHLDQTLGLDELARLAAMPSLRFGPAFKASTGTSPHRYVMQCRIERACRLLRAPRIKLADVAVSCGFCDQSHMSRAFRLHLGTTPGKYQEELSR